MGLHARGTGAALLMEFVAAPHERWAELTERMHDTEHADDDTTH